MAARPPRLRKSLAAEAAATGAAPARRASGAGRLGISDWILAGQDLLREQGIAAIKLAALTRRLGVSTGSFYHHFSDIEEYLGALADHYSVDRVKGDLEFASRGEDGSPLARLQRLARQSLQAGTFELDHAMRIWATMDARPAAALRRAESLVLAFIETAFRDLGFDAGEAALRARILLSANVSPILPTGMASRGDFFRGCLRLLVADAPALAGAAAASQPSQPTDPTTASSATAGATPVPGLAATQKKTASARKGRASVGGVTAK